MKISITIRRQGSATKLIGKSIKTIDGIELIKKVTSRAITRLLCEKFNILFSEFDSKKIEYQPVFTRDSDRKKRLSYLRIRYFPEKVFSSLQMDEISSIGVTEAQVLEFLRERHSAIVLPTSEKIYVV